MNEPAPERTLTAPAFAGGIDRSPLVWPLVVAALLVPALVIAMAARILGLV